MGRRNIIARKASREAARHPYVTSVEVVGDSSRFLPDGDKCERCERKNVWSYEYVQESGGNCEISIPRRGWKEVGIVVGFVPDGRTTWREIADVREITGSLPRLELDVFAGVAEYGESSEDY